MKKVKFGEYFPTREKMNEVLEAKYPRKVEQWIGIAAGSGTGTELAAGADEGPFETQVFGVWDHDMKVGRVYDIPSRIVELGESVRAAYVRHQLTELAHGVDAASDFLVDAIAEMAHRRGTEVEVLESTPRGFTMRFAGYEMEVVLESRYRPTK